MVLTIAVTKYYMTLLSPPYTPVFPLSTARAGQWDFFFVLYSLVVYWRVFSPSLVWWLEICISLCMLHTVSWIHSWVQNRMFKIEFSCLVPFHFWLCIYATVWLKWLQSFRSYLNHERNIRKDYWKAKCGLPQLIYLFFFLRVSPVSLDKLILSFHCLALIYRNMFISSLPKCMQSASRASSRVWL